MRVFRSSSRLPRCYRVKNSVNAHRQLWDIWMVLRDEGRLETKPSSHSAGGWFQGGRNVMVPCLLPRITVLVDLLSPHTTLLAGSQVLRWFYPSGANFAHGQRVRWFLALFMKKAPLRKSRLKGSDSSYAAWLGKYQLLSAALQTSQNHSGKLGFYFTKHFRMFAPIISVIISKLIISLTYTITTSMLGQILGLLSFFIPKYSISGWQALLLSGYFIKNSLLLRVHKL